MLNNVPFDFEVQDLGNSFLYKASFPQSQPVGLSELFRLLQTAKPGGRSRDGQSLSGINADWRIILPEVREKEPEAKRLYHYHREHVPGFSEFEEKHFPLLWNVFQSGLSRHEEVNFFNYRFERLVDEEKLLAEYGREAILSNPQIRKHMLNMHVFYFGDFLRKRDYKIPLGSLSWSYVDSAMSEESLGIDFYESLIAGGKDEELHVALLTRTSLTKKRNWFVYQNGVVRTLADFPYPGPMIPAKGFTLLENGQIEIRQGDSFMRISMVKGEDGYKEPKMEELHLQEPETMIPLIVWKKDKVTGKRVYHCGRLDGSPRHDTLLEQLFVSAYSPKVRDQMPLEIKMIGVDGAEKTQPMLEAQTILLVPRFASNFLTQSPVILELEKLGLDRKSVH